MSELKWNWAYYPYLDAPNEQEESALKAGYIKVVIKDEADKVIAEKDAEIVELKKQVHVYAQGLYVMQARVEKKLRHHKFKRCLVMVKYCDMGLTYYNEKIDSFSCERADFFYKWYNRWWKIAEKFKEAK